MRTDASKMRPFMPTCMYAIKQEPMRTDASRCKQDHMHSSAGNHHLNPPTTCSASSNHLKNNALAAYAAVIVAASESVRGARGQVGADAEPRAGARKPRHSPQQSCSRSRAAKERAATERATERSEEVRAKREVGESERPVWKHVEISGRPFSLAEKRARREVGQNGPRGPAGQP